MLTIHISLAEQNRQDGQMLQSKAQTRLRHLEIQILSSLMQQMATLRYLPVLSRQNTRLATHAGSWNTTSRRLVRWNSTFHLMVEETSTRLLQTVLQT